MPVGNDSASAFAHLEQRVSYLLERLESSSDHRSSNLGRVEEGLQDILHHLERQHASFADFAANSRSEPAAQDNGLADLFKRELSDIRFSQAETDRHTQDRWKPSTTRSAMWSIAFRRSKAICGRLACSPSAAGSSELRGAGPIGSQPLSRPKAPPMLQYAEPEAIQSVAMPPPIKPELPNPAATQEHFAAAPRDFHPLPGRTAAAPPRTISEILEPHTAPSRLAIDPDLPPDHPLNRAHDPRGVSLRRRSASRHPRARSATFRPPLPRSPSARRASLLPRAAPHRPPPRPPPPDKAGRPAKAAKPADQTKARLEHTSKIRSLLVGASVVVIVLGTFRMAMTLLDTGAPPAMPATENSTDAPSPADNNASPAMPAQTMPSMTSPTPIGRQSFNNAVTGTGDGSASVPIPQNSASWGFLRGRRDRNDPALPGLIQHRQAGDDSGPADRAAA